MCTHTSTYFLNCAPIFKSILTCSFSNLCSELVRRNFKCEIHSEMTWPYMADHPLKSENQVTFSPLIPLGLATKYNHHVHNYAMNLLLCIICASMPLVLSYWKIHMKVRQVLTCLHKWWLGVGRTEKQSFALSHLRVQPRPLDLQQPRPLDLQQPRLLDLQQPRPLDLHYSPPCSPT